ncbi:alpha/beta fold hydrolase [Rhodoferax saidenbachensis]|uniref:Triacylglycerol esterase/lipase EstA (Alpha/beta hydrolase family) n=1 Tax=Rhodoferax saidenbachensis TaxID=1484693 RepID=A0ABU1ZHN6_9BURK|nr:alpha/beta fold hydrolase [Rhodoferax saidenbachensis]MDR7305039.1 triacylglycerol esterase/lipase EstA (alpha/beta hydrolase family) [Rhodoferax saidenbachensis]
MLARLLRRILFSQMALGALLGWAASQRYGGALWLLLGAIALPCATLVGVNLVSALKSRAPGEPAAHWWRAWLGETVAEFQTFVLRQPWTVQAPVVLPATGGTPQLPVVLVHGYLCNHRLWDPVATQLRARGHAVLAVNLEPVFTSIDDYAAIVEAAVQALRQHAGTAQVLMVGHSMGGLAIRAWMRAHGTAHVARAITLGTPHAGTQIDAYPRTPNGRQMGWNSAWLQALAASESAELRALLRIAITPQDNIVYPQRAQTLPGITPTVFDGVGHVQLCTDATVIQWLLNQLRDNSGQFTVVGQPA